MKIVPVSETHFATVDDSDFERLSKLKWWILRDPNNLYASANIKKSGKWTTVKMHRMVVGDCEGVEVDHVDGNGLNNQRSNLRICSRSENKRHQFKTSNILGFKGVSFDPRVKSGKPYQARVRSFGKTWSAGYFSTPEDAACAYNRLAIEKFGDFANLNAI